MRHKKLGKQSEHVRRVRTRDGVKKRFINLGYKRKPKKFVVLKPEERDVFKYISKDKFTKEYGGGIDFDLKGVIENISLVPGEYDEIDLPADYEVLYHTHPVNLIVPPSPTDLTEFLRNKKQQADLVFNKNNTYIVLKTKFPMKYSSKLEKELEDYYDSVSGSPGWVKKWIDFAERKTGLKILQNNNPKSSLMVPLEPVEPVELVGGID